MTKRNISRRVNEQVGTPPSTTDHPADRFRRGPVPVVPTRVTLERLVSLVNNPTALKALWARLTDAEKASLTQQMQVIGSGAGAPPAKTSALQSISGYMQNWAKSIKDEQDPRKKIALAKEVVNFLSDRKDSLQGTSAVPSAIAVIKKTNLGNIQNTVINALKSGSPMNEGLKLAQEFLEAVSLTWNDLGLELVLNESQNQYEIQELNLLAEIRRELKLSK